MLSGSAGLQRLCVNRGEGGEGTGLSLRDVTAALQPGRGVMEGVILPLLFLEMRMGRRRGRHTHGDGGRRGYRVLHPGPWCVWGLGLYHPFVTLQEGFYLSSGPVFLLVSRSPVGLRKEALGCLSFRILALGSGDRAFLCFGK